jgi:hypothetical protein
MQAASATCCRSHTLPRLLLLLLLLLSLSLLLLLLLSLSLLLLLSAPSATHACKRGGS